MKRVIFKRFASLEAIFSVESLNNGDWYGFVNTNWEKGLDKTFLFSLSLPLVMYAFMYHILPRERPKESEPNRERFELHIREGEPPEALLHEYSRLWDDEEQGRRVGGIRVSRQFTTIDQLLELVRRKYKGIVTGFGEERGSAVFPSDHLDQAREMLNNEGFRDEHNRHWVQARYA